MTYRQAVWMHVYAQCKESLHSTPKRIIGGFMTFGITWATLAKYGSSESTSDLIVQAFIAAPASLAALCVLHVLWSLAFAPRQIYAENQKELADQRDTIARLQDAQKNNNPKTSLEFREPRKRIEAPAFAIWMARVANTGEVPATNVKVRLVDITAIGGKSKQRQEQADVVKKMHLLKTHSEGQPQRDSIASLVPGIDDEFDCVATGEAWMNANSIRVCHSTGAAVAGRPNLTYGLLVGGQYTVTLQAEAENAPPVTATLAVNLTQRSGLTLKMVATKEATSASVG